MLRPTKIFLAISLLMAVALLPDTVTGKSPVGHVVQLTIEDAIGPATDDYVARAAEIGCRGGSRDDRDPHGYSGRP